VCPFNIGLVPNSLTFSTQFYTYPYMASERAKLYLGEMPPKYAFEPERENFHQRGWSVSSKFSENENSHHIEWPGIMYKYGNDGRPEFDRFPGIKLEFLVDANSSKPGENIRYGSSSFPNYLKNNMLFIDIWDGDSLLYLGTASVELKNLLRQGKPAVTYDEHVDIILLEVFIV
jgi:nephrocystin-4